MKLNLGIHSRGGLILNIGSFASLTSSPLLAVYAGTKAFLYTWSQALGCELADAQVDVSLVDAYFIVSDLSKIRKSNWLVPMPKAFVRECYSFCSKFLACCFWYSMFD